MENIPVTVSASGGQRDRKRRPELSLLNLISCAAVIFIHVSSAPVTTLNRGSWQYALVFCLWRLASFAVPAFFTMSAVKLFLHGIPSFQPGRYYLSRFRRIVLPYLAWVLIYYLYFVRHNYFPFSFSELLRYICVGDLVSHFYFVIAMVQFYALVPLWIWLMKRCEPVSTLIFSLMFTAGAVFCLPSALSAVGGISFLYNDRLFTSYLFYWIAGCLIGLHYEKFLEMLRKKRMACSLTYLFFTVCDLFLTYFQNTRDVVVAGLEILHMGCCMAGVLFFFMIADALAVHFPRLMENPLLVSADRSSYAIFLSHCLAIFIINDHMAGWGIRSIALAYGIRIVFVYTVTVGLCVLFDQVRRRFFRTKRKQADRA